MYSNIIFLSIIFLCSCSMKKNMDETVATSKEINATSKDLKDLTTNVDKNTAEMKEMTANMNKNTTEMKDLTVRMDKNTSELKDLTVSLDKKTSDVNETTNSTEKILIHGGGSTARDEAFQEVLEAKTLMRKITAATKYFMSMDFQLTTISRNENFDVKKLRDQLTALMVTEFAKKIEDLLPFKKSKYKVSALEESNEMQSLYALAAAMHRIDPYQSELLKNNIDPDIKVITFYDVITQALALSPNDQKGLINRKELSQTQKEVLREYDRFIYLLKLRYKVLPVIALARMSNIKEGFWTKIKMSFGHWQVRQDLGTEQINYLVDIFKYAKSTQDFLHLIGVEVILDKKVARIYRHLDWNASSLNVANEKNMALKDLQTQISNLK